MKLVKNASLPIALLSLFVLAGCGYYNKRKDDNNKGTPKQTKQEAPSEPLKGEGRERLGRLDCPEGYEWDSASRACIVVSTLTCPAGEILDLASGACVASTSKGACLAGETLDPVSGACVASASKGACPAGETLDPVSGACLPNPTSSSCPATERLVAGRGCVSVIELLASVKSKISDPAYAQTAAFSVMKKYALKQLIQDLVLYGEVGLRKSAVEILNGKGGKGGIRQKLGLASLELIGMRLTARKHKAFVEHFKKDYLENSTFIRNMRDKCFDDSPNPDVDACVAEGIVVLDSIAAVQ